MTVTPWCRRKPSPARTPSSTDTLMQYGLAAPTRITATAFRVSLSAAVEMLSSTLEVWVQPAASTHATPAIRPCHTPRHVMTHPPALARRPHDTATLGV